MVKYKDAVEQVAVHRQDHDNMFHCNCGYASQDSRLFWKHAKKHNYINGTDSEEDETINIAIDPALLEMEKNILGSALEEQSTLISNITEKADNTPWMARTKWLQIFTNVDLETIATLGSNKPEDDNMEQIVAGIRHYYSICNENIRKCSHLMLRWLGEYSYTIEEEKDTDIYLYSQSQHGNSIQEAFLGPTGIDNEAVQRHMDVSNLDSNTSIQHFIIREVRCGTY